jgi:hypothetical protein
MGCFASITKPVANQPPDPSKHVNYALGMVLGVDDFTQEFAYLSGRDQWLARDLLGYGTVRGLKVTSDKNSPRVEVSSGVALSPRGQLICVPENQCANLNDWIAANREEASKRFGSPPSAALSLYVVLCYRDCKTDNVPIPGEPCRTEEDVMAASRIADSFELKLSFDRPDQCEEDAVRAFVAWLRQVGIADTSPPTSMGDFLDAVRNLAASIGSPPVSPPDCPPGFMFGSPPGTLSIPAGQVSEYLRESFRIWVTELRPLWGGNRRCGVPPENGCLMLAELTVPLVHVAPDGTWKVDESGVAVNEEFRPYVVHLRMVQEWMLHGMWGGGTVGTLANFVESETTFDKTPYPGTSPEYSRADHTHGTPPSPVLSGDATGPVDNTKVVKIQHVDVDPGTPALNQVLTFSEGKWIAKEPSAGVTDHGDLTGLTGDDHKQYLLVDSNSRKLIADLNASGKRITNLPLGGGSGEPVVFQQAVKNGDPSGGDLGGTYPSPKVIGLQNKPVSDSHPHDGDVLTWSGTKWIPKPAPQTVPTGDFVEHPKGGSYAIVAAGLVKGDGTSLTPVYNGLKAKAGPDGLLTITFGDYEAPSGEPPHQYIVKVLPVVNPETRTNVYVNFVGFKSQGVAMRVADHLNQALKVSLIKINEFMIEVSRYPAK